MENPFLPTARPRFVDRDEIIGIARRAAGRMAQTRPDVKRVLLFGSFARGDYSARSDIDFLILLGTSPDPSNHRLEPFLSEAPPYPSDVLVYTESELEAALASGNPFIARIIKDAIELYPAETL